MKSYKKLNYESFSQEIFSRKKYFSTLSLENARMAFRVTSQMVPTVRKNFTQKYKSKSLKCPSCQSGSKDDKEDDTQSHLIYECEAFTDLREQLDPDDAGSLAEFFKEVISRRLELGEDQDFETT